MEEQLEAQQQEEHICQKDLDKYLSGAVDVHSEGRLGGEQYGNA